MDTERSCILESVTDTTHTPPGSVTWIEDEDGELRPVPVEVARVGDSTYLVPGVCKVAVAYPPDEEAAFHVSVEVGVVDGEARIRYAEVIAYSPMTPLEVQRIPWAEVMEAAVVANSASDSDTRKAVAEARVRERRRSERAHRRELGAPPKRSSVTDERLAEVLQLKATAQASGRRWDTAAAKELNYSPAYVRRLGVMAEQARADGRI